MQTLRVDTLCGAVVLALAAAFAWEAAKLPLGTVRNPGAAFFPLALACLLALGGVLLLVGARASQALRELAWPELGHAAQIIAVCAFASVALEALGYRLTVGAMLLALLAGVERQPVAIAVAVAGGVSAASYWVFAKLLLVQLPTGPWGI
jgi:hypothetical protein